MILVRIDLRITVSAHGTLLMMRPAQRRVKDTLRSQWLLDAIHHYGDSTAAIADDEMADANIRRHRELQSGAAISI